MCCYCSSDDRVSPSFMRKCLNVYMNMIRVVNNLFLFYFDTLT